MHVNVYAEHVNAEATPEVVTRVSGGEKYIGLRIPLVGQHNVITFWDRADEDNLRDLFAESLGALNAHFACEPEEINTEDR